VDGIRFDTLVRSLAASRRALLGGVLAFGTAGLGLPDIAARKKPKDKPQPNQYGCLEVGDACKRASQCCSSLCKGKPRKKTCRAHGAGTCSQKGPGVCTAPNPYVLRCNNEIFCSCLRTTAGSNYCGDNFFKECTDCQKDADCEKLGFPAGSACVPLNIGACSGGCESGMGCFAPCGSMPPEEQRTANRTRRDHAPIFRHRG
jgi:hypothetical protein